MARKIEAIKFQNNIPKPVESVEKNQDKYVSYGVDNNYPNFLLKLYNECPVHASIINSKASYIIGDGIRLKDGTAINKKVNAEDSFDELISKIVKDYLIFNCFAIEVVYDKFKKPIEYHFVPANRVRCNKSKTKFWVSENWSIGGKSVILERWKEHTENETTKLFFFDGYNPSNSNVYPAVEYAGAVTSILTDIEIRNFNLNNIKNHFSVSTIITFFRGSNIAEEVKDKVIKNLKESYTGSEGKKLIVDFQDQNGQAAEVKNISPNDWDKAYELVSKSVKEDIIQSHSVVSPMLFGVKIEGQLGGATELETAYEIFQNNYTRNKQNEILSALNLLFSVGDFIKGELLFTDKKLFNNRVSDALKEKIYTLNELRKEAGLPEIANGDRLLNESVNSQPVQMSADVVQLSEEDFEKIKDMGVLTSDFDFIEEIDSSKEDFNSVELKFETIDEVSKYILDNKLNDFELDELKKNLRKDLGINVSNNELKGMLDKISKSGVMNVKVEDGKVNISNPSPAPETSKVEVVYSYAVRPGYGQPIESNTRAFCKKLIQNDRYYTREEVQIMTSIFGYDVMKLGGGFYRNPSTGEVSTHCRHFFKMVAVKRKIK